MSVRLIFFITEFIKSNALFTVLVVEQHDDFIVINVNAVYENAMSLAEEICQLRSEVKRLNKDNKRLQEERDFLNEAAAFFRREPSEVKRCGTPFRPRSQYTSASYRAVLNEYGVRQSMNSAGGRCHDNACCCSKFLSEMCKTILTIS